MAVNKCLCHNRSFEEIKMYAQKHDIDTIEELQARNICSCGCRMCLPYVEKMLATGKTSFKPGTAYS
jgi:NAD(P)H-nitrite reductase large subunit